MTKYVTRACVVNNPQDSQPFSITHYGSHNDYTCEVFEAEAYRDTGLLDASGQTIWATDKLPIGFGRADD